MQADLFPSDEEITLPAPWPRGLRLRESFIGADEEQALIEQIAALPFAPARYKSYTARRCTVSYGGSFDYDAMVLRDAAPIPELLLPLRKRAAAWLGVSPEALVHALVAQYAAGTPLGWHRDVPDFEAVVGVSLAADARMRFRPYPPTDPRKADVLNLTLHPRSAYILAGPARWDWQHSVAPVDALRYSVTFRTRAIRR